MGPIFCSCIFWVKLLQSNGSKRKKVCKIVYQVGSSTLLNVKVTSVRRNRTYDITAHGIYQKQNLEYGT